MSGSKKLVIVESPTKAKTIANFLGEDYEVVASVGHIRDLAEPAELPADMKKGLYAKFAVDIDNGFVPYYVVNENKKKTVAELKKHLKNANELWLATDEDREGEAIAWHILEVLKPKIPVRRMVFHEITKEAIKYATDNTRDINISLVDAQETRRILDRLYGYDISPVLWRKIGPKLSAGRVQSAATRLVVEREKERMAFVQASYWSILGTYLSVNSKSPFEAKLSRVQGQNIAQGKDFSDSGELSEKAKKTNIKILSEDEAENISHIMGQSDTVFKVEKIEQKPYTRKPAAPFTTSTLQQEASRKLKFTSRQTMSTAQSLYERGFITYMRTDSPTLSKQAVKAAKLQIEKLYGNKFIPSEPRKYKGNSKNAQEAHEAIRPAGEIFRHPDDISSSLSANEIKLYDLIWKRTIASQMADAKGATASLVISADNKSNDLVAEFNASGTVITFSGFLQVYEEGRDEKRHQENDKSEKLPDLYVGEVLNLKNLDLKEHFTQAKPRYTEASLTKKLEELGIGRPSTYTSILSTITDRGYVKKRGEALVPSWTAFSVVRLLEDNFSELVAYDFTAMMEDDLDKIASGLIDRKDWLNQFYFGNKNHKGLQSIVSNIGDIDAKDLNTYKITEDISLRIGRYGPYLEQVEFESEESEEISLRRVNLPEGIAPDELNHDKAIELFNTSQTGDLELGMDPETGNKIVAKEGRFGPYVTEVPIEEKDKNYKPRSASLFKSMSLETITFEQAVKLLQIPRFVGLNPENQEEIYAHNGRFGAYIKCGNESRSLDNEEQILDITLDEAIERLKMPKYGAKKVVSPLKVLGIDPESNKEIKLKDGRFGPYVTDGLINATIPRGEDSESLTYERAVELLSIKRAKGPSTRAKKTTTKKSTANSKKK